MSQEGERKSDYTYKPPKEHAREDLREVRVLTSRGSSKPATTSVEPRSTTKADNPGEQKPNPVEEISEVEEAKAGRAEIYNGHDPGFTLENYYVVSNTAKLHGNVNNEPQTRLHFYGEAKKKFTDDELKSGEIVTYTAGNKGSKLILISKEGRRRPVISNADTRASATFNRHTYRIVDFPAIPSEVRLLLADPMKYDFKPRDYVDFAKVMGK